MMFNNYFWPGKIGDTGAPAISGVGEAYWEGGIAGVGIVFFILGSFFKSLERYRVSAGPNLWVAIGYMLFLWFWAIYSHEVFLGNVGALILYWVVLTVVYKLTTVPVKAD